MAISEKKRAANRANARRSTGPRTAAGKRAVARNALIHGLTSQAALLPRDDPHDYRRFGQRILDELLPEGALQIELALEIVNLSWKLRRVPGAESILMVEAHGEDNPPPPRMICKMILAKRYWSGELNSPIWTLDRYANRIERSRASALRMFLALQKRKPRDEDDPEAEDLLLSDDGADVHNPPVQEGASFHHAPVPNKPTAAPPPEVAQAVVFAPDTILDSLPADVPAAPNKATGPDSTP